MGGSRRAAWGVVVGSWAAVLLAAGPGRADLLDPSAFAMQAALDLGPGAYRVDTTALTLTGPGGLSVVGVDAGGIAVFDFASIHVGAGAVLTATGSRPLALLSMGPATIDGTIDVSGTDGGPTAGLGGPGGGGESDGPGAGSRYNGGGFGGPGAVSMLNPDPNSGRAYGDLFVRLQGGSGGGPGSLTTHGGGGGGALEIGALGLLQIQGSLLARGGNGFNTQGNGVGGGGSGGGLLLHASDVVLAGLLDVRGGGGPYSGQAGGGRVAIQYGPGGFSQGGTLYLGNGSFSAVPEPSAVALLGLGLAATLGAPALRARRKGADGAVG